MINQQPSEVLNAAAPPPGGYGGGGYGPPQGGGFGGSPPGGGGYGGPPQGGGFGAPPGAPPPGGAFGAPPAAPGGYAQPAPVPAGFGAVPGGGGVSPELQKKVDKWSMISMITFFFGCGILALVPIMMSNGAKDALKRGDAATAESKIGTVKILCILGFVNVAFWLLMTVVYAIFMIVMSM